VKKILLIRNEGKIFNPHLPIDKFLKLRSGRITLYLNPVIADQISMLLIFFNLPPNDLETFAVAPNQSQLTKFALSRTQTSLCMINHTLNHHPDLQLSTPAENLPRPPTIEPSPNGPFLLEYGPASNWMARESGVDPPSKSSTYCDLSHTPYVPPECLGHIRFLKYHSFLPRLIQSTRLFHSFSTVKTRIIGPHAKGLGFPPLG